MLLAWSIAHSTRIHSMHGHSQYPITEVHSIPLPHPYRPDYSVSPVIVVGGRGVGSKKGFEEIYQLADHLHGNGICSKNGWDGCSGWNTRSCRQPIHWKYISNWTNRKVYFASCLSGIGSEWSSSASGWHKGKQSDHGHQQRQSSQYLQSIVHFNGWIAVGLWLRFCGRHQSMRSRNEQTIKIMRCVCCFCSKAKQKWIYGFIILHQNKLDVLHIRLLSVTE